MAPQPHAKSLAAFLRQLVIDADKKTVGFHNLYQFVYRLNMDFLYTGDDLHKMNVTLQNGSTHIYNGSGRDNNILQETPSGNPNKK